MLSASLLLAAAATAAPTFYRDIAPILQSRCERCHRPGEIGPMPLRTYREVRPWAKSIRQRVALRSMPPWFADRSAGHFANDPSLTNAEIATIERWVEAGAPEGDPAAAPAPLSYTPGWNIAKPDLVLSMAKPFPVPARGEVNYQFIVLPQQFSEDRWVSMVEVRPSARSVVHHAVLYVRERDSRWLRGDPSRVTTSDILAVYTPGQTGTRYPAGLAKKIPAGADLVLQMHYTASGKATADRTSIGLVFAVDPPQERVLTLQLNSVDFKIPPGERRHRVSVSGTIPNDARLLSMFPHMHLRGAEFEYEIVAPGGQVETLLHVKPYDFYWQLSYELAQPRLLRKGTRLRATAWFDNSPNNPRNPDPTREVTYGEQSREEMMAGFFDVAVPASTSKDAFFIR